MPNQDENEYRPKRAALPLDEEPSAAPAAETPRPKRGVVSEPEASQESETSGGTPPADAVKPDAEKPGTDEPAAEKPTAEQPTAEQPTAEQPAAQRPTWSERRRQAQEARSAKKQTPGASGQQHQSAPQPTKGPVAPAPEHPGPGFASAIPPEAPSPRAPEQGPATTPRPKPAQPRPTTSQSATADAAPAAAAASAEGEKERPENPFAPKETPGKKRRFGRNRQQEEAPVGKRAAEPRRRFDGRNMTALVVTGVAAVSILAVIISYALWANERNNQAAGQRGPVSATPGPVLGDSGMITDGMAKTIDPGRSWTAAPVQTGIDDRSPSPTCIIPRVDGQPSPNTTLLRQIQADEKGDKLGVLHRADAYDSPEIAAQMFGFRSTELGGCTATPFYVEKGMQVTGLGNQAVGVRLVLQDQPNEYHSVLMVRTGRVLNIIDAARLGTPPDMESLAKAASHVINRQCGPATGLCSAPSTKVDITIPPPGGDHPGFLASGDIPRVTLGVGQWKGNAPATRMELQDGTMCESIDFGTVSGASKREMRTYLLRNDPAAPPQFGIDQVVLQMDKPDAAGQLVDKISQNIEGCETRLLTAKVNKKAQLNTPGLGGTPIRGNWFIVTQKVDQTRTQKFRVGIMQAGQKVIYLRANPSETFDFSDDGWIGVNLRAGERATQVR